MKWIKFGLEAVDDYNKEESKIPVFSIEWLIHQNLQRGQTKFSSSQKSLLLMTQMYQELIEEEKRRRINTEMNLNERKIKYSIHRIPSYDESYLDKECFVCRNYAYFSYQNCKMCKSITCLIHKCNCKVARLELNYREL